MADFLIRRETPADYREVEVLTREAFWNVYRPGCLEHYLVHRYRGREGFVPELDLVLEMNGRLVGHIMYVHAAIHTDDGKVLPVMTFGPISIAPECQRRGLGKALLDDSLARAAALGAKAVCIEGNPAFYGKSGFVPAAGTGVPIFCSRSLYPAISTASPAHTARRRDTSWMKRKPCAMTPPLRPSSASSCQGSSPDASISFVLHVFRPSPLTNVA